MYQARVLELKQLILAEEARFKSVAAEIEAIRAGKWFTPIERRPSANECPPDKLELPPQSEQADAVKQSASDLTGLSDPSPSVSKMQISQTLPEEETVQRQLDESLAMHNSSPSNPAPSAHEDDVEALTVPQLSPASSPVATGFVDEHVDVRGTPQLPNESPDLLDIITPTEDSGGSEPFPTYGRGEAVSSPSSPPLPSGCCSRAMSAEPKHFDVAMPPKIVEIHEVPDSLEHHKPSEAVERFEAEVETEVDEPTETISHSVEDKMSAQGGSGMSSRDYTSVRAPSEPPDMAHSTGLPSPLPLDDATTTSAAGTPLIEGHEGLDGEGEIHLTDKQPETIQVRPEDKMEVDQGDDLGVASPVAEQSHRDHKRKVSEAASTFSDSARDRKRSREDSQPVDEEEPGPVRRRGRPAAADSQTSKKFQTVIIMVHSQISQHRNGNIFHNPIKTSEAPDYYDIVKRPMDLKTIKAHIREGQIASSAEFQRDVYLMFANSLMYNRPGSDIYTMAEEMMWRARHRLTHLGKRKALSKVATV
ncbi:hypothetical protein B0F90DRAFT_1685972, partial [Multifurca ochricompacta]